VSLMSLATLSYLIAVATAGCGIIPTTAREQHSGGTHVEAPQQQVNTNQPAPVSQVNMPAPTVTTPPGTAGGTSIQLSDAATVTGLLAAIAAAVLALQAKKQVNGIKHPKE